MSSMMQKSFAGGEIARHHLYGYTGVLTVFTA